MGWVEQRGKKYRLSFRYGGKMFRHSLGFRDPGARPTRTWP